MRPFCYLLTRALASRCARPSYGTFLMHQRGDDNYAVRRYSHKAARQGLADGVRTERRDQC